DLFVSTKLAAEIKDYDGAVAAIDESLARMSLNHIDLMLIHSPQPWDDFRGGDYAEGNRQAWRVLEEAHRAGTLRSIGLSNYQQKHLQTLRAAATVARQVSQLLVHAGNAPGELLAYCESRGSLVEAYSPIAHGAILTSDDVRAMARKY